MKKNFAKVLSVILAFAIATSLCAFSLPVVSAADSLPDFVDNSESPYFPAIENQGSLGACVYWAETYYQFTYTMNKAMGVATTRLNPFSPSFTLSKVSQKK
ncbi:MAG: hypothetical protein IJ433_02775 [Ruminococcus sp.]|nr:hypothetical protein [Ruminococcus sp.]